MKLQISIETLRRIINAAAQHKLYNDSLSSTLEIEVVKQSDTHTGDDHVQISMKSSYSECNNQVLYI